MNSMEKIKNKIHQNILFLNKYLTNYQISLAVLALFVFSLSIYAGMLNHGFVWDDERTFVKATEIREFKNIPSFFVTPLALGDSEINSESNMNASVRYYRPLLATLHVLEYHWFGTNPLGYKIVNLIFNGVVVICAFFLVRAITGELTIAFLAALLYAANPGRGEVVYWVYSDSHIFAALFSLLCLISYHYKKNTISLVCMALALLFQEGAVLVLAVLLVYYFTIQPPQSRGLLKIVPFILLSVVYFVARHLAVGSIPVSALDFASRFRAGCYILVKYVKVFFITDAPVTMYRYVPGMFSPYGVTNLWIIFSAVFVLMAGCWIWLRWRSWAFWYGWFLIWISLALNVGGYVDYLMAEKGLYLAALGPCVLLAKVVSDMGRYRWVGLTLFLALFSYQAMTTVGRGQYWKDTTSYIEKVVEFEPEYDVAQFMLGVKYLELGQYEKAVSRFETLQKLSSPLGKHRYIQRLIVEACDKWGRALTDQGEIDRALIVFEKSRQLLPGRSDTCMSIGVLYYLRGDWSQASSHLEAALQLDPKNIGARFYLEKARSQVSK